MGDVSRYIVAGLSLLTVLTNGCVTAPPSDSRPAAVATKELPKPLYGPEKPAFIPIPENRLLTLLNQLPYIPFIGQEIIDKNPYPIHNVQLIQRNPYHRMAIDWAALDTVFRTCGLYQIPEQVEVTFVNSLQGVRNNGTKEVQYHMVLAVADQPIVIIAIALDDIASHARTRLSRDFGITNPDTAQINKIISLDISVMLREDACIVVRGSQLRQAGVTVVENNPELTRIKNDSRLVEQDILDGKRGFLAEVR